MKAIPIGSLSFQKANPHLFNQAQEPHSLKGVKVGVSTDEAKLNKLESQWLVVLRSRSFVWIGIQNITWKIADDCRYTSDFVTVGIGGKVIAWETKGGFFREDAKVKIKVAARMFPWVEFVLVTRDSKSWKEIVVKS